MNKRNTIKLMALLIAVLMTLGLTACGGSSGGQEESNAPDEEQVQEFSPENDADFAADEAEQEESGPKEVSAFDMNTTYEYHGTYFDEKEGYDREYSSVSTEMSKLVDCKVFPSKESSACIVALHFNKTFEKTLYDAQGNEMDRPTGTDEYALKLLEGDHLVKNIDTGEAESLWDYEEIDEVGANYIDNYEGLGDYLREEGYDPNANEDLYDDTVGTMPYSNRDFYRFWWVEHGNGTLSFHMKNSAIDNDHLTVKSYNDAEQIMIIEL